jgi:hypothetical protein
MIAANISYGWKEVFMSQLITSTLSSSAFWIVNKRIAQFLGENDAALLLSDLISKREYFRARNELDSEGGFFNTTENIETDLNITKEKRLKYTNLLIAKKFLVVVKKGLPSKNYYYIQDSNIQEFLTSSDLDSQSSGNTDHLSSVNPAANKNKYNKNKAVAEAKKEKAATAEASVLKEPTLPTKYINQIAAETIPLIKDYVVAKEKENCAKEKEAIISEVQELIKYINLTEWEKGFLGGLPDKIKQYGSFTVKQKDMLDKIKVKVSKPDSNANTASKPLSKVKMKDDAAEVLSDVDQILFRITEIQKNPKFTDEHNKITGLIKARLDDGASIGWAWSLLNNKVINELVF